MTGATLAAIGLAVLAAIGFAVATCLQHGAVRAGSDHHPQRRTAVRRLLRSRRWLVGGALASSAATLHVVALSLAPVAVVQPVGTLSLAIIVLIGIRSGAVTATPRVLGGVAAVAIGTTAFVAATSASTAAVPLVPGGTGFVQAAVLGTLVVAAAGLRAGGRIRCALLATATAAAFGIGAVLIRAAVLSLTAAGPASALPLAAEAVVVLLTGCWLLQQAYAAGPPGVVVAITNVVDPFTAVVLSGTVLGVAATGESVRILQLLAGAVAVGGVAALARSIPDPRPAPISPQQDVRPVAAQRILICADTFPPDVNGAANFAARLAGGLAHAGREVHVLCPAADPRAVGVPDPRITVHSVPSRRTPFHPTFRVSTPWTARRSVAALLDRVRPDVVHVQSHFGVGRAALRVAGRRGIPVVATNHFMPDNLLGYAPILRPLHATIARWAWRDLIRVFAGARLVTAPTPRAVQLLRDNGWSRPARAISCGIDLERYAGARTVPAFPGRPMSVLFVGRLDAEKHVDELIHALALLPAGVQVRADIVGRGTCARDLTELAERLHVSDRVRLHGLLSDGDLIAAYRDADVFCMPGTAELQSLATMEAMASALPVVAADAMALPHLVRPGINGWLYPPGDVAALSRHLEALARSPEQRSVLGRRSLDLIATHGLAATLEAFQDGYAEAMHTGPILAGTGPALVSARS